MHTNLTDLGTEVSSSDCLQSGRPPSFPTASRLCLLPCTQHRGIQELKLNPFLCLSIGARTMISLALSFMQHGTCYTHHVETDAQLFISRVCSRWHTLTVMVEVTFGVK